MPQLLKRNIFQRIFGICATKLPRNDTCWSYGDDKITIDLETASELAEKSGGLRLEGGNLPVRVMVVHGEDGQFHAVRNKCEHAGRRLDPVPGEHQVQCCSIGKSTYAYDGTITAGSPKGPLTVYPVERDGSKLIIKLK